MKNDIYRKVKARRILSFNEVNCDIFIKLSEDKYVAIIRANSLYDSSIIVKYMSKGVEYFYVNKDEYIKFSENYYSNAHLALYSDCICNQEKIELLNSIHELVTEHISNIGIDKSVIEMIDKVVSSSIDIVKKDEGLFDLLSSMINAKDYLVEHSMILVYLSCAIALKMGWSSNLTLKKLALAGMLHDLEITNPVLAIIHDCEKQKIDNIIDSEDRDIIHKHTLCTAEKIHCMKNYASDVYKLILEHHENPEGNGFPGGISSLEISSLSALLILTEDFVSKIYFSPIGKQKKEDLSELIKYFKTRYSKGNYQKPLEGLLLYLQSILKEK
ncbi:MAG: hypothetical protein HQK49_13490 [Oligoflexia bacterium]|nr:hypothetical protein [Oligoflexia bacterium]